jgi:uncharacterized repeat protein (TIGR03803 family)
MATPAHLGAPRDSGTGEFRFRRMYTALSLQVRPRTKRKVKCVRENAVPAVSRPNERWSIWRVFTKYLFCAFAVAATSTLMLSGCSAAQKVAPPGADASRVSVDRDGYVSLYSFGAESDGQVPKAGLIDVGGALYGTTYAGGLYHVGTVFRISTAGQEAVLYSFRGGEDGANPSAALLAVKRYLYGTTEYGGETKYSNDGTVFRITPSGSEKVLYRFQGTYGTAKYHYDGANPVASLIDLKGKLYGTTYNGGAGNYGTVFSISKSGNEKVLHSFAVYSDGINPAAPLLYERGSFYGTTMFGPGESGRDTGYGTIFSMSASGVEKVLFSFYPAPYGSDGTVPLAALIGVHGKLYGITSRSGPSSGTAFSITPAGNLSNLHSFGSGTDGSTPAAPLLNVRGTLYGTTSSGGVYGQGTVFSLTRDGTEKVLHSFGYGSDGAAPLAGLTNVSGTLYGTTSAGGANGTGTVFALKL